MTFVAVAPLCRSSILLSSFSLVLLVLASGCTGSKECDPSEKSPCFKGEQCVDGKCVVVDDSPGDTEVKDSGDTTKVPEDSGSADVGSDTTSGDVSEACLPNGECLSVELLLKGDVNTMASPTEVLGPAEVVAKTSPAGVSIDRVDLTIDGANPVSMIEKKAGEWRYEWKPEETSGSATLGALAVAGDGRKARDEMTARIACEERDFYPDDDEDGWGDDSAMANTKKSCLLVDPDNKESSKTGDCDDTDSAVNPGAKERCNFIDDDCDAKGVVDDGCRTDVGDMMEGLNIEDVDIYESNGSCLIASAGGGKSSLDGETTVQDTFDAYVMVHTCDGTFKWGDILGSDEFDYARGVAFDDKGAVHVTGRADQPLDNGTDWGIGSTSDYRDGFVARYEPGKSKPAWIKPLTGDKSDKAFGIDCVRDGVCYVVGKAKEGMFGERGHGSDDAFLVRLDKNGNHQVTNVLGGNGVDRAYAVKIDPMGNAGADKVYVGGTTDTKLGTSTGSPTTYTGGWVGQIDPDGRDPLVEFTAWAPGSSVRTIEVRKTGRLLVAGESDRSGPGTNALVAEVDTTKFDVVWESKPASSGEDAARGVALLSANEFVVVGNTEGDFEGENLPGKEGGFFQRYTISGGSSTANLTEILYWGDPTHAEGVAVESTGRIHVGGTTNLPKAANKVSGYIKRVEFK